MLVLALLSFGMAAGEPPKAASPVPPRSGDIIVEGNRRICRSVETTGSILSKKTCKTKTQWDGERAASMRLAEQRSREQTTYQQMQIYIENQKKNKDN